MLHNLIPANHANVRYAGICQNLVSDFGLTFEKVIVMISISSHLIKDNSILTSRFIVGATSTGFWCLHCTEQSLSYKWTTLPSLSAKSCTSICCGLSRIAPRKLFHFRIPALSKLKRIRKVVDWSDDSNTTFSTTHCRFNDDWKTIFIYKFLCFASSIDGIGPGVPGTTIRSLVIEKERMEKKNQCMCACIWNKNGRN